jgi:succinyl-diaminopimelate desuccinylase
VPALSALLAQRLDDGTEWFEPSSLQITSIDAGNEASNVIPAAVQARLNIRFNDLHTETALTEWLTKNLPGADLQISCSGEAFLTKPGPETAKLLAAITRVTGIMPVQNTGGGTSDARFIAKYFPVAEFGLVGATMHQADECVPVAELRELACIYRQIIESFAG